MTSFSRYYKQQTLIDISMADMAELIKDKQHQQIIAEHVYERLYNRFLKIFDFPTDLKKEYFKNGNSVELNAFVEEYKNGFLIMTSCSLLIETFAAFLEGHNETPKWKSKDMFNKVFDYAAQKANELAIFKDGQFYQKIRCGLLHQGETYGKFKISRKGFNLLEDDTIDAILFLKNLKFLLEDYKKDLSEGNWDGKEWNACRLKIGFIISNAS